MWSRIAQEMALPWRAIEAMHWQIGEQEMARRAGVTPFSLAHNNLNTAPPLPGQAPPVCYDNAGSRLGHKAMPNITHQPLPSLAELTAGLPAYTSYPPAPYQHPATRTTPQRHVYHQNAEDCSYP